MRFLAALRGGASPQRIEALCERLELDQEAQVSSLSKGNRQKLGLVQAFMHTPRLLILDEPTSGLDPLGQQIFLEMVAEAAGNGQTVFMSSHIMSEVEAVADRVGIIRDGRLVTLNTVSGLRANAVRDVEVTFAEPVTAAEFAALPAVRDVQVDGATLRCQVTGSPEALLRRIVTHRVTGLLVTEPALEDLFHGYRVRTHSLQPSRPDQLTPREGATASLAPSPRSGGHSGTDPSSVGRRFDGLRREVSRCRCGIEADSRKASRPLRPGCPSCQEPGDLRDRLDGMLCTDGLADRLEAPCCPCPRDLAHHQAGM